MSGMDIRLNTEYFYKSCLFTVKDELRPSSDGVYIYDLDGKRFYVASNGYGVIEFNEPINGDPLPIESITFKKPSMQSLRPRKNTDYVNLIAPTNKDDLTALLRYKSSYTEYGKTVALQRGEKIIPTTTITTAYPNYRAIFPTKTLEYDEKQIEKIMDPIKVLITQKLGILLKDLIYCGNTVIENQETQIRVRFQSENMRFMYWAMTQELYQNLYE
jgi:hypothetical protein